MEPLTLAETRVLLYALEGVEFWGQRHHVKVALVAKLKAAQEQLPGGKELGPARPE